jgi:glycosyltransferase involved in cell wall biosynthesis
MQSIGVVVPTLQSARTLDWTLLSITSQKDIQIEPIVVDSGSNDGTLEICRKYGVRSVYAPPGNMYRAINVGMERLTSEWVTYLNSDDYVYDDSYARLVEQGRHGQADVVYGYGDYVGENGRFLYSYNSAPTWLLQHLFIVGWLGFPQPAAIYRKRIYTSVDGFDENYRLIGDFDFYRRVYYLGAKFVRLGEPPVVAFRVHAGSLSSKERDAARSEVRTSLLESQWFARVWRKPIPMLWQASNYRSYLIRHLLGDLR